MSNLVYRVRGLLSALERRPVVQCMTHMITRVLPVPLRLVSTTTTHGVRPSDGSASHNLDNLPVLRSLLFVPGFRDMMAKALTRHSPDAFVLDMEDSVPVDKKPEARDAIRSLLPDFAKHSALTIPRVNSPHTQWMEKDLEAVIGPHIYGISVGKIDTPGDMKEVVRIIDRLEAKVGLPPGTIRVIPWLESASAVVHAYEIASSTPRIVAVAFGAEDYTNDMGIERTDDGKETSYARTAVAIAARAAGVLCLDTPFPNFRDSAGHHRDCLRARSVGCKGKFAIHPSQIDTINHTFSPYDQEVEEAHRILDAWETARAQGRGSTSLDGKMVDAPVVNRARNLLRWHDHITQ